MHARPAGPTLLQRPGRQTYGKGSVLHGTGPSFPSAALSSPTRILLVHERGDHAPQPLHGGIPDVRARARRASEPISSNTPREAAEFLNSSVPATSRASVSEQVKQRSERLTICTALKKYGVLTARGLAIQASETDASIALSTHSGPGRTSTYLCARHSSSVSAPASSNLRASE